MANDPAPVLQDLFRAVFNLSATEDVTSVSQETRPEWDSLATVTLVTAIESEFNFELDPVDALELTSYDAVLAYVRRRVG